MTLSYKRKIIIISISLFVLSGFAFAEDLTIPSKKRPLLQLDERSYDLGIIKKGMEFGYGFTFKNKGEENLRLLKAIPNSPGEIKVSMPKEIPAGEEGIIHISQDSNRIRGKNILQVIIQTDDPDRSQVLLTLSGYVQWPVEILPKPRALMKVQKGESKKRDLALVNHTEIPLKIEKIEFDENLFGVRIKEEEKGKRFELEVFSQENAPVGEHRKNIFFYTNIPDAPKVGMIAWLKVQERIFMNLEEIDFGERPLSDILDPKIVELTNEIVLINGMSTPGFKVLKVECNIDFIGAKLDPIAKNRVHRVDVFFQPEKAKKGTFKGDLTILTNDEEFKKIVIPVHGELN
jgi:hypothetical protein